MKNQFFGNWPMMSTVVAVLFAASAMAQDAANVSTSSTAAPQLSYGVPQVLQLTQAKVSDSTVVAYIQNSGTIYALDASQIVYLKQQGVSDAVLNAMLNQRKNVASAAAPQNYPDASQNPGATAQPATAYVQTPSAYVAPSTVYVIPDSQTYNYDANYYGAGYYQPYWGGYYYPYPAVSFSFGFGSRVGNFHGGGFRGGFGGGWHRR